ncbi:hypothetical protein D2U88_15150 [Flagellimonas aequoris]|uniref:Uncharacterized protein n=1 Tax=Flagellimonas aequoris TaxID=2306997 RepID=A0A418N404_9FLAO|nr:hypothetical protein D2U88_15150 [Allomuricauda aequoris]
MNGLSFDKTNGAQSFVKQKLALWKYQGLKIQTRYNPFGIGSKIGFSRGRVYLVGKLFQMGLWDAFFPSVVVFLHD